MEKKVPMRMCIACREMKAKKELLRIVKTPNGIFPDTTGKLNGRGAYVCKNSACVQKLKKSKALNRAFSCEVPDEVYALVEKEIGKED